MQAEFFSFSLCLSAVVLAPLGFTFSDSQGHGDAQEQATAQFQIASFWNLPYPVLAGFFLASLAMIAGVGALGRASHRLATGASALALLGVAFLGPSLALATVYLTRGVFRLKDVYDNLPEVPNLPAV